MLVTFSHVFFFFFFFLSFLSFLYLQARIAYIRAWMSSKIRPDLISDHRQCYPHLNYLKINEAIFLGVFFHPNIFILTGNNDMYKSSAEF